MRLFTGAAALALSLGLGSLALAQPHDPAEAVIARQGLMYQLDADMAALEIALGEGTLDPADAAARGASMAAMLRAFPFLFPPESNFLADPASTVTTSADPRIWAEPTAFAMAAANAVAAAEALSAAAGIAAATPAIPALRATCEACHATYLRYQSPFGMGALAPAEPAE